MTSMKIEKRILKWRNPQQHNSTQLKLSEIIIEKPLEKIAARERETTSALSRLRDFRMAMFRWNKVSDKI